MVASKALSVVKNGSLQKITTSQNGTPITSFGVVRNGVVVPLKEPIVIPAGLTARWRFDQGLLDDVASVPLTLSNTATVTGRGGVVLSSPSVGTAAAPESFFNRSAFTVEFWLYSPTTLAEQKIELLSGASVLCLVSFNWRILSSRVYRAFRGSFVTGGVTKGTLYQVPVTSSNVLTIPEQEWQHLAFTYNGSAQKLYRNGVEVTSVARSNEIVDDPTSMLITISDDALLDDVSFWNRALSASEISARYAAG